MKSINWRRVLMGGFVAGVLFNVLGIASAILSNLADTFARFGVEPDTAQALMHVAIRLGLGFASVLVYAGFRAAWAPGPWTAVRSGAIVWFIGYVPGSIVLHELGAFTDSQLTVALVWGLGEAIVATLVGAWLYRGAADASA